MRDLIPNAPLPMFAALLAGLTAGVSCAPAADLENADALREAMVSRQIEGREVEDKRVLKAMREVPRHKFVPARLQHLAYDDTPLPIGHDQTISQPFIVAFMTETLDPKPTDRVLEVGTGSGYQAAVLSRLVADVYSIEIVKPLAERSEKVLAELGYENVHVKAGDGYEGWPEHAPFDAIIVTCAPDHVPAPLVSQLKDGGRMVIPVGAAGSAQTLYLLRKREGEVVQEAVLPVRFVPMTGDKAEEG